MGRVYYGYKNGLKVVTGCDLDYEGEVIISDDTYGIEANAFRYCSLITSVTIPSNVSRKGIGEYAFCECTSLESVTISSIYEVPTGCFKGCKNLKNINFSPAIIGDYSFENCTSLTSLSSSFLNSIQQIGIRAFHHSGLINLTIPYNVTSIGDGAFNWCPLESIKEIPNWCTASSYFLIEDNVLYNADKTELILYPPFKTDTTFTIPETVTRINKYAFEENYYMEKIRINNAMVTLEGLCGLMNIKDFECYNSDGVIESTSKGYRVLTNTTSNKKYLYYQQYLCRVPVDETSLDGCPYSFSGCLSGAFAGCTLLTTLNSSYTYGIGGYGEILRYKCFYKCSSISSSITLGLSFISGIDDYAFAECKNITDIILNTVGLSIDAFSINEYAFYNCSKINTISLNVNAQKIITKTHSFENCQQLTTLTFPRYPDSTEITSEKNAFLNTANSQSNLQCEVFNNQLIGVFGVPDNGQIITPISDNKTIWRIWKANPNVASIVLGEGMTKLMGYTFCNTSDSQQGWSFTNLQHIKLPSTLTEIGGYAFYKTSLNMSNVDFSNCNNITTVEPYAFYEVTNLNINLDTLKYAGQRAFYRTVFQNTTNININDNNSLVVYESSAFYESTGLENVNIICNDVYIGTSLSNLTLGDNKCTFQTIQYYNASGTLTSESITQGSTGGSFEYCQSEASVNIVTNNLNFTGMHLFAYSNINTLNIKAENQTYDNCNYICQHCHNLKEVVISGIVPDYAFGYCYSLKSIKFYKMKSSSAITGNNSFTSCETINTLDFSESSLTDVNMQQGGSYNCLGYSKLYCLKELILPSNLISLTLSSYGLKGKSINLPKSLINLTIAKCPALSEIDIPSSVTSITFNNSYSNYNHSIRKLKVPNSCAVNNGYYVRSGIKIPIKITYY